VNDASGKPISMPLTSPGTSNSITFTLSTPGQYTFRCQVHPTEMIGDFFVVGATGSAGGASGSPTPTP
jgi:plastocyanin